MSAMERSTGGKRMNERESLFDPQGRDAAWWVIASLALHAK